MKPCPKCGSYRLMNQTPIKIKEEVLPTDNARKIVGKWVRSIKDGNTPLEGPVFIMCRDCLHKGPSVDCSGRTREDVGQDKAVYDEMKQLWNSQESEVRG